MRGYSQTRAVDAAFQALRRITVDTAAGKLERVSIRDAAWADRCPWLAKLIRDAESPPSAENLADAEAALLARGVVKTVEVMLISGPAVQLAQMADDDGAGAYELSPADAYCTASPDVPGRPLQWPNIAEAHEWYWGTDGQGAAVIEVVATFDVLPDTNDAKFLR